MQTQSAPQTFKPNKGVNLEIDVNSKTYLRLPIKTPLITEKDDILELVRKYVAPFLRPGDIIFISEKVLAITQGRIIKIRDIKPTRFARFLARKVRTNYGTKDFKGFGHGTPMGMQLFIEEAGYPRVLFAAAVSAITRPLGIKGAFYFICGKRAKSVDCPMSFLLFPYTQYAKLAPLEPSKAAKRIKERFGNETVIVDANYRGVVSLGESSRNVKEKFVQQVFRDNPLGQSDEQTPLCIVREKK